MAGFVLLAIGVSASAEVLGRCRFVCAVLRCVGSLVREQMSSCLGRRLIFVAPEIDSTAEGERARIQQVRGAMGRRVVVDRGIAEVVAAGVRQLLAHIVGQMTGWAALPDGACCLLTDGTARR